MIEPKCSICGEDCFEEPAQWEDSAIVPVRYIIEKKQVCSDCYQILRELGRLG
jgi:hypothetical protein